MFRTAAVFTVLFVFVAARLHGLEKEVAIQDLQLLNQFQGFAQTYNKKYDSLEEARERFQIYKANQLQVHYYQQLEQGTAEFGENKFMDMTNEQFEENVLSTIIKDPLAVSKKLTLADIETSEELPQSHDWRDHGLVNRVKDQEQCGSCWAFSVVGNIEGQWKRKTGELISLSEQELVDCDFKDLACKGGEMNWAYGEIIRIGGLVKEEDYEYVGQKCFCRVDEHPIVTYINDSLQLPANEEAIRQYLFKNGPISIGLNAKTLKHYKHGIHHPFQFLCKPEDTNHAVLLVGYGEENGKPYWLLKNSWGESWGEKGYFRVFRGKNWNTSRTMYRAVLLALLTLSASARLHGLEKKVTINELELFNGFQNFTKTFDKNYASLEEAFQRYQVYKANQLRLQELQQSEQGTATYGATQFMDLTPEEFRTFYLSNITVDSIPMRKLTVEELKELKSDAPTSLDHRQNGFVTGVKDQGKCGACWAFSVVGNIEGLWKRKSGDLVRLSEQELVDCDRRDKGCQGGNMLVTYSEIIRLGGLVKEEDYPYKGRNERCNLERNQIVAKIDSFVHINQNEETIKQYLYEHGPISVGINANPLQYYSRGVFHPTSSRCSPRGLNHAVTLVGYGVDGKDPYWLVKNSWGTRWGENGYFRIYRGANVCGIAAFATSAVIN